MRRLLQAAVLAGALAVTGCGDDEPDAVDAVPDPIEDNTFDFDTLDANGDSYLDTDEIAEHVDSDALFDEWDADRDSELDSDEIAGNAFELWDADLNGTIDEDEWKDAIDLWYPGGDPVVFNDWDNDGDSELDADEFTERFDYSLAGESWTAGALDEETFKTAYFELYDLDGDGKVSESEFDRGARLLGSPSE